MSPATLLLAAAWSVVAGMVAAAALRRRARREPVGTGRPRPGASVASTARPSCAVRPATPVETLGAAVRRLARSGDPDRHRLPGQPPRAPSASRPGEPRATVDPQSSGPGTADRSGAPRATAAADPATAPRVVPADDRAADRRAGWSVLAGLGLLAVAPALAAVPVMWSVALPVLSARRRQAAEAAALADQLPDVVDLLTLTAGAGLPVGASLRAIRDRPGGPMGVAMARAAAHVDRGGTTADALAVLRAAGPAARPLVDALTQHDRYGSPLVPALDRVGVEARARRRRRAEEAARRLPVTLLLPLVLTTFPAFVLLTIVPLLAGSLGSLSLSPT